MLVYPKTVRPIEYLRGILCRTVVDSVPKPSAENIFDRMSVFKISFRPFPTELKCVLLPQDVITYALQDGCSRFR